eukprot:7323276-Pyramimonas_sp.AAC.1
MSRLPSGFLMTNTRTEHLPGGSFFKEKEGLGHALEVARLRAVAQSFPWDVALVVAQVSREVRDHLAALRRELRG